MSNSKIVPDIYNMSEVVETIKAQHMENVSDSAIALSLFGFIGSASTQQLTQDLQVISESSNEVFPIKSKFEKNILVHAVMAKIKNMNAVPAKMEVMIGIRESDIDANMTNNSNTLVIDKDTKVFLEDYEYHLDYNIILNRTKSSTGENIYMAKYDMDTTNPVSTITEPYLLPPVRSILSGDVYILITCTIRQVEFQYRYNKIKSNDSIENKSFQFEFDSQLAHFDLVVEDSNKQQTVLEPLWEGSALPTNSNNYCYYSYVNSSTIRIKFISGCYNPQLNDNITVRIITTQGSSCNFPYKQNLLVTPQSNTYNYNNLTLLVIPISDSEDGVDKKSISDLKRIIPKELLSRDSIIFEKDLENYFNMINDENINTKIMKKIDNQVDRIYYAYIIMKLNNNIVPTNTCDLKVPYSVLSGLNNIIKAGTIIELDINNKFAEISTKSHEEVMNYTGYDKFYYTIPYNINISKSPLISSYYMNIIDLSYLTQFTYINQNTLLQFLLTSVNIKREFIDNRNFYRVSCSITQNNDKEYDLLTMNNGNIVSVDKLKALMLFHDAKGTPIKYKELNVVSYDSQTKQYDLEMNVETDDIYDITNSYINVLDLNDLNAETTSNTYLPRQTKVMIYIFTKLETEDGLDDATKYFPNLEGYTLCNKYTVDPGLEFFINFTEITNSVVVLDKNTTSGDIDFHIKSVPLVQYKFMQDSDNVTSFIDNIINRKIYIDDALSIIKQSFGIDLKLYNTYGPSKIFTVGHNKDALNRTNIKLRLRLKLDVLAKENLREIIILEIKNYMEDINDVNDFHYSNLDQYLRNKFPSILWIEFLGINNYGPDIQYIRKEDVQKSYIPEFLNINTIDGVPDIDISIV